MHGRNHPAYGLAGGLRIARLLEYALGYLARRKRLRRGPQHVRDGFEACPLLEGRDALDPSPGCDGTDVECGIASAARPRPSSYRQLGARLGRGSLLILPPSSAWSRSRAYRAGLCFMRPKMGANRAASRCHFRHLRHNTEDSCIFADRGRFHGVHGRLRPPTPMMRAYVACTGSGGGISWHLQPSDQSNSYDKLTCERLVKLSRFRAPLWREGAPNLRGGEARAPKQENHRQSSVDSPMLASDRRLPSVGRTYQLASPDAYALLGHCGHVS